MKNIFGLSQKDFKTLKKLSTPIKIQDYLDGLPVNYEKNGETIMSPQRALKAGRVHCFEGAMIAALALWINGEEPLLLDLKALPPDVDHVVALYKRNGLWGAISKTNHATIRFRDPVYKTFRELALSYFHEWFVDKTGKKTMRSFSTKALNLKKYGTKWVTDEKDLQHLSDELDSLPHEKIVPKKNLRYLRKADAMERKAGKLLEWDKSDPRT
ncbi:MAG: hypothetical protein WC761_05785 [Candidatus Paceibacterota bacterium]|jgi:hypothetical protein